MTISITVSGHASDQFAPERAHVSLSVVSQGPDREAAVNAVATSHTRLSGELTHLAEDDSVSEWSSGSVSTYSYRPRNNDGEELAVVQVTNVALAATFADLSALSPAIDRWLRDPLISVRHIRWSLTEPNRRAHEADIRRTAVEHAVEKAQAYADALGAGQVEAVEIADTGMLPSEGSAGGPAVYAGAPAGFARTGSAAPDAVELRPQDIHLSVSVDARFTAAT